MPLKWRHFFLLIIYLRDKKNMNEKLTINQEKSRFELDADPSGAHLNFRYKDDNTISLDHTKVPRELEGKGIGGQIVSQTLQYAKDNNLKVVPLCSFVASYITRHPEWKSIVAGN